MKKYSTQFYGGKNSRRGKKKAWRSKLVQTQLDRKSCKHTNTFAIPMLHFLCFNTHIHTHTEESVLKSSLRPFTRINSEKHLSVISSHCLISHTHTHFLSLTLSSLQSPGAISSSVNGVWETPTSLLLSSLHNHRGLQGLSAMSARACVCVCVHVHTCTQRCPPEWNPQEPKCEGISHVVELNNIQQDPMFYSLHGMSLTVHFSGA